MRIKSIIMKNTGISMNMITSYAKIICISISFLCNVIGAKKDVNSVKVKNIATNVMNFIDLSIHMIYITMNTFNTVLQRYNVYKKASIMT